MKNKKLHNLRTRMAYNSHETQRCILKSMQVDANLPASVRVYACNMLKQQTSRARVYTQCAYTGRSRSVYRDFRLSRIQLRLWFYTGILPGVRKSSW
jgi:ribosomal protein S14